MSVNVILMCLGMAGAVLVTRTNHHLAQIRDVLVEIGTGLRRDPR